MKATELRIGNFVQTKGFETLVEIDLKRFKTLIHFEPIPLTEKWLEKLGFELINDFIYWIQSESVSVSRNYNDGVFFDLQRNGEFIHSELMYVHQLQNLYFALTNKELKLTI